MQRLRMRAIGGCARFGVSASMITEMHVLEEARNIALNQPVASGDTISHKTAAICEARGWAIRDADGNWIATALCLESEDYDTTCDASV